MWIHIVYGYSDIKRNHSSSTLNVTTTMYIFQSQKETFLSQEELQMSVRGAEDKEMEKQVFA